MHQLNEDIRDSEIRLIGSTGEQLGIMSAAQAQRIADEQGLDLVKISPQATPPVCKLMDYGKFRFEQGKREKEAKKNQHVVEIKEIRMSPGIDVGDFNTKLKNAQKFLADGNRVKVSVRFRGREMAHTDIGKDLLVRFAEQCAEVATLDKEPKLEGRSMSIFLSPGASIPRNQKPVLLIHIQATALGAHNTGKLRHSFAPFSAARETVSFPSPARSSRRLGRTMCSISPGAICSLEKLHSSSPEEVTQIRRFRYTLSTRKKRSTPFSTWAGRIFCGTV